MKQFKLRFPLFVWHPDQSVTMQVWEAMSPETESARDLRCCAYKVLSPNADYIQIWTLRDIRDGVAEYWPVTTDVRFPLIYNMKEWGFALAKEEPIYGNPPPGHAYCGVCGEECQTMNALDGKKCSLCCWGSLWADPSLTVEWVNPLAAK